MHLDISSLLEQNGVKVSIIQYGERKSDYSLFKPLSDSARSNLQKDIDAVGEMFVEMVGRNRNLTRTQVRSTEAGMFMGADAVEQGIADAVMSPQAALEALIASI
jgi:ClpP class serine protease